MQMPGMSAFAKASALTFFHQNWPTILRADFLRLAPLDRRPALDGILGKLGTLEVRLARSAADVRRAQRLRYEVFYGEMSAKPGRITRMTRRDADRFDQFCDHLLVIDRGADGAQPRVVGAYRLLRQEIAERHCGFYTQDEFDIDALVARHPGKRFLELGRSCVLKSYRDRRTVELLWQGVWAYVRHHRIDVMFGCASFAGTDPDRLAAPLSYLARYARADGEWRTRAHEHRAIAMDNAQTNEVDMRIALRAMPPLIKGYLRVGARFSDQAVIDQAFNTTDVLVILPTAKIDRRYIGYFGEDGERFAA
ncbi:MAG: GNAT family N-acyltransferase [Beijerinckiaceae bacterium]